MSIVIPVLFAVAIGLSVSILFAVLSPRDQCRVMSDSGAEWVRHNVCVLPRSHEGPHITADGRPFGTPPSKNSTCPSQNP